MELYHLKTFTIVAEMKNLTRAAVRLNTTPPSISNHIKLLEEELGLRLFTRTSKGMELTSQGIPLLSKALDILQKSDDFYKIAKTMQHDIKGHISFGINADSEYLKIPETINSIYQNHPKLNIEIITSNTGEIMQLIEAGKMDCGFAFGEHKNNNLESVFLAPVDLSIVIPIQFRKNYLNSPVEKIAELPWIVPTNLCPFLEQVKRFLASKGTELSDKVFANDDITKHAFLDQGIAVSILEKNEALKLSNKNKVFIWKGPEKFESSLSFIYSKDKSEDLLIETVTSFVKKSWNM